MKEIQTNNFKKRADLIESPPIDGEPDGSTMPKKKKMKYIYQLNKWVEDTSDNE